MGFWEYLLIAGAVVALASGYLRVPRLIANLVFLGIAIWPMYTLGVENGWGVATIVIIVAIIFAIYFLLYWVGTKLGRGKAA